MESSVTPSDIFTAALFDTDNSVPSGISGSMLKRFQLYRNNVVFALTDAIMGRYPAVHSITGQTVFRALAAEYCRLNPPRSPVLISYGATFPEFLAENVLQADLGCLHEVARLDTAWWEAYHAEEAIPLTPGEFAQQFEGEVGEVRAVFHPSVKFLEIGTFAQRSWQNARGVDAPANLESEISQTVFVARPYADVIVHALPEESAQFLRLLVDGASIASAVEIMAEQITTFDAITQVQDLMNSKLITFLKPV